MPSKKKGESPKEALYRADQAHDIQHAIYVLIDRYIREKEVEEKPISLTRKNEQHLVQRYKNDELSRSKAGIFIRAFAEIIGVEDPAGSFFIASMKEWAKATRKFNYTARNLYDLGRGTLYIDDYNNNPNQYHDAKKCIEASLTGGKKFKAHLLNVKGATIIADSVDDYLEISRKSGYASAVHLDLEIDNKKGRIGNFELQIKPWSYKECDKHSHIIYDLMDILDRSHPSDTNKALYNALFIANTSLFFEHANRTGYIKINKTLQEFSVNADQNRGCWVVLDMIRTELGKTRYPKLKRPPKWFKDSLDACTYAKTSVSNAYHWTQNNGNDSPFHAFNNDC